VEIDARSAVYRKTKVFETSPLDSKARTARRNVGAIDIAAVELRHVRMRNNVSAISDVTSCLMLKIVDCHRGLRASQVW
jgi:hypothetical protein